MKTTRLAFIGAGNMARSLIGGLVADGWDPACISVSDPDTEQLSALSSRFQVNTDTNNHTVTEDAEVVVLAVKPQVIRDVALDLADLIQKQQPLLISIAAGIRATDLQRWLGGSCALVRCMPNTPALVQSSATALWHNENVTEEQTDLAETILRAVGLALWVESEDLMDSVTALSGSGPAYFFLFMEAMIDAGCELGLDRETATTLAMQTGLGASRMAVESDVDLIELRRRVTSPAGTTERAIQSFEENGLRELVTKAMRAAAERADEMAREMG